MMNNKGYTMKEMIVLCGVLAIFFALSISRVSYAYSDIDVKEDIAKQQEKLVDAAEVYIKKNKEKFQEEETYIFGKELVEAQFIIETDETNYSNTKLKITYNKDNGTYKVEIVP